MGCPEIFIGIVLKLARPGEGVCQPVTLVGGPMVPA